MVVGQVVLRLEREPPPRLVLDGGQARAAGADQDGCHVRRKLDEERLRRRRRRETAEAPFGIDGERLLGDDDAAPLPRRRDSAW